MPVIAYNMAAMCFKIYCQIQKNDIIYFGAQMKGWRETSEANGRSAYAHHSKTRPDLADSVGYCVCTG